MSTDRFVKLIENDMRATEKASLGVALGDSHQHAFLKGKYSGLETALKLYRDAHRTDTEE